MVVVELPLPPQAGNSRRHWRTVHRERKAYYEAAKLALLAQRVASYQDDAVTGRRGLVLAKRPPGKRHVVVAATFYLYNRMDPDNAVARLKHPLDVLVQTRFLWDDSAEWMTLGPVDQVIDRKRPRLVLHLGHDDDKQSLVRPGDDDKS